MTRLKAYVGNPIDRVIDPNLPYVALEHIEPGTGVLRAGVELEGKVADDSVGHLPGDVRFGKLRPYLAKSFLATEAGVGSGELIVLRPRTGIYPRFLWYLTLSRPFIDWAVASSYGVKMPRTTWEALGQFDVQLPSLEEQRRIVKYLDTETARNDELVEELHRLGAAIVERSMSNQQRVATRGCASERLISSQLSWLGDVPASWQVVPLKSVARMESGHTPSRSRPELWENCSIPWISLNDVGRLTVNEHIDSTVNLISQAGVSASSARVLPAGTVVLSRDATIGRTSIMAVPMATSQHFAAWVCGPRLDPRYLWLLFTTAMQAFFGSLCEGSTIRTIGMPELRTFKIPLPPVEEQQRIVAEAESARATACSLDNEIGRQVALLQEHRQALITAAVTGGLGAVGRVA